MFLRTILIIFIISVENLEAFSPRKFVVLGATGRTGKLVVEKLIELAPKEGIEKIVCPVRSLSKGRSKFGPESKLVSLVPCNLDLDRVTKLREVVSGSDAVIICSGYSILKG
jgi:uncharacterized protein YbjT (DUF2867 family)